MLNSLLTGIDLLLLGSSLLWNSLLKKLTLFMMGLFGAAHGWGMGLKGPLPKICHTYLTMIKLGTIIPYLKEIQKIFESLETLLEFCNFSVESSKVCYTRKYMYRLHFHTKFLILLTFLEYFRIVLTKKVTVLMMSAKMVTPDFSK